MEHENFFMVVLAYVVQAIVGLIGVAIFVGIPLWAFVSFFG